ncbi:hypothetical protein L0337_11405 [candidate division KSB1 bacterium]|nr:hypothetical protein [candidate division KSB1 bacterium]
MIMAFFTILLLTAWSSDDKKAPAAQPFAVEEATIAEIHAVLRSGKITCRQLVEIYLERIAAYDQSTKLNAIVVINPKALETAEAFDKEFAATGKLRPLHGVPFIVKDNYETKDLQTAAGSIALKGFIPARTVEDAAKILQVIAGYDPADPLTQACVGKVHADYTRFLDKNGLKGARLGVLRALINTPTADSAVTALMEKAIADMRTLGATIIDPFAIPDFDSLRKDLWCNTFQYDVNNYFASLGERAPAKNLAQVVASGMYSAYIEERLRESLAVAVSPEQQNPPCSALNADPRRVALRQAVLRAMDEHNVDAIVYPYMLLESETTPQTLQAQSTRSQGK